jgi:hypothetical protein
MPKARCVEEWQHEQERLRAKLKVERERRERVDKSLARMRTNLEALRLFTSGDARFAPGIYTALDMRRAWDAFVAGARPLVLSALAHDPFPGDGDRFEQESARA